MKKTAAFLSAIFCASAFAFAASNPAPTGQSLARTFPYSMIGQVEFYSGRSAYVGSGTVIKTHSVLTAGHVMWDPDYGWSTHMLFTRSLYSGSYISSQYARRKYILGGYSTNANYYGPDSVLAFANDMGAMVFRNTIADGAYAGWWANPTLLTSGGGSKLLGYGAEFHTGDELLSVTTLDAFTRTRGGFYENDSISVEGGMSGGPVLED